MSIRAASMTSNYASDEGCPEPSLRRIAEAGFRYIHWCHHWETDFLYDDAEIDQIAQWMRDYTLSLNDLHSSHGREKSWGSHLDYQRRAGVALMRNRIVMASRLGCDVVVVHMPDGYHDGDGRGAFWDRWAPSLDELAPLAAERGVRLAVENTADDNFDAIEEAFERYGPDYLGLCYDAGHGNLAGNGLDRLEASGDRLISVHLHDNDGADDLHRLPFTGTVDWDRLARLIVSSGYAKEALTFEVSMAKSPIDDEVEFLAHARRAAGGVLAMIGDAAQPT